MTRLRRFPTSRLGRLLRACGLGLVLLGGLLWGGPTDALGQDRPNILWISAEDLGPDLGAYGDPYADTPHLDSLAARGLTYRHVWSNLPVCAPARTTMAAGMYASSLGAQHMRSFVDLPPGTKLFPQYLHEAGYFTTNRGKEDFNVPKPGPLWDEHGENAHWRHRDEGQPFFSVFNTGMTHESQTAHAEVQVDTAETDYPIPAFQPDLPATTRNWATYYRQVAKMDRWAGARLRALAEAGLADETIVFFWGDHGPGLPRGKRFAYNFGLRVPLIVYVPPKYRERRAPPEYAPGATTDRPVSFVDFAPTVLSLAGIEPPAHMQGRAFMGVHEARPRDYLYGARGRMDERIDMVRTVRDTRFQLIRNYMPHRRHGQYVEYLHRNPVMDKWRRLTEQGAIGPPASFYWTEKPPVELYDLKQDPDQVHNLAYDPDYQHVRRRLMEQLRQHQMNIRDTGFLPEAQIHARPAEGEAPYTMAHDPGQYPLRRIRAVAERAAGRDLSAVPALVPALSAADPAVRYWAATGLLIRGRDAVWPHRARLRDLLAEDPAPTVRVVAAEALARYGTEKDLRRARQALLRLGNPQTGDPFAAIAALNVVDKLNAKMLPVRDQLAQLPKRPADGPRRASGYTERLLEKILADLQRRAEN
ncbi:MAG: sulfatase-like hydrolase/transferase [Salinibacter sp.]